MQLLLQVCFGCIVCCCRYTVHVQVSDDAGSWASHGVQLIVRKAGDDTAKAACCRSTGLIIAQQLGRPIDPATFRPSWINSSAAAVGWDAKYLLGPEDLEAERLFDYTLLAPLDTGVTDRLSTAGSMEVFSAIAGLGGGTLA